MAIYINGTKANNGFAVSSGSGGPTSADQVSYDNTTSGLTATDVQEAIDEVVENKADRVPEPAEYDPTATYAVGDYCIYNNTYYCCISAISTPEAWTQAHWTGLPTPQQDYLHSIDPAGIGTLSMNRASGSTIGLNSVAVGYNGTASGTDSHAEGGATTASGYASHAEGLTTTASGDGSHAEGRKSKATGNYAHAEGYNNIASKEGAHAEGSGNSASQTYAHAEGSGTTASGSCSHSEGILTTASGTQAHAEGIGSVASGTCAHAEGDTTVANHKSQHVFGEFNIADASSAAGYERGNYIEIVGNGTSQTSSNARTLDWNGNEVLAGGLKINNTQDVAIKPASPPEYDSTATYSVGDLVVYNDVIYVCKSTINTPEAWNSAHWLNLNTTYDTDYLYSINPTGIGTFSLNRKPNTTIGLYSFTEGYDTTSSGFSSHAEGYSTAAGAVGSHAEGYFTEATGSSGAHAEGNFTTASGNNSHAEGQDTAASEDASHAEGYHTTASGKSSHAEGTYTTANHKSQHVFGEYNIVDPSTDWPSNRGNYVEIVGNGTANNSRANARTLDWSGNEVLAGGLKINSTQDVATQVSLTQAEYDALVSAGTVDLVNTIYFITDADAVACSAAEVTYSNTTSGMLATNVQSAIDEVADVKGKVTQINKTDNATYSLLLATDNTTTTATGNAYKSSFLKYNPSTEILSLSSSGTPSINSIVLNPSSGGYISVNNVSTTHPSSASMSADSGGGHIWVTTPDGMGCVNLGGTSTGGVVKVTDQNRAEKIVLTGSTGAISCNSIMGRTWFPYWSASKQTYSNTSVTFTTSATVSNSNFIWIVGDANGNPIFSILSVHTTIRPATLKNLAYSISVAVDSSGSSITISAPQWSTIRLVSDIPWS